MHKRHHDVVDRHAEGVLDGLDLVQRQRPEREPPVAVIVALSGVCGAISRAALGLDVSAPAVGAADRRVGEVADRLDSRDQVGPGQIAQVRERRSAGCG